MTFLFVLLYEEVSSSSENNLFEKNKNYFTINFISDMQSYMIMMGRQAFDIFS